MLGSYVCMPLDSKGIVLMSSTALRIDNESFTDLGNRWNFTGPTLLNVLATSRVASNVDKITCCDLCVGLTDS